MVFPYARRPASRGNKADSLRSYVHPTGEDMAALAALLAPDDARR